jgi:hypothetical protein
MGAFPVFQGRGLNITVAYSPLVTYVLENLVLYGGTYGLNCTDDPTNLGPYASVCWSHFNDLVFMNQTVAAINSYLMSGWDSNSYQHCDFINTPIAVCGYGMGNGETYGYSDKQNFNDCQFQNVGTVWHWDSQRAEGGHVFSNCYFYKTGQLTDGRSANCMHWHNCVMDTMTGPLMFNFLDSGGTTQTLFFSVIDCLFTGPLSGIISQGMTANLGVLYENCLFATTGGSILSTISPATAYFWNCQLTGTTVVGDINRGIFVNSLMGPQHSSNIEYIVNGVSTILDASAPTI